MTYIKVNLLTFWQRVARDDICDFVKDTINFSSDCLCVAFYVSCIDVLPH